MSKFAKPALEVTRFNEADVIVASGSNQLTLYKFGNGSNGDAYATYMGKKYPHTGQGSNDDIYSVFNKNNTGTFSSGTSFYWNDNEGYTCTADFNGIIGYDSGGVNNAVDGTYTWNGTAFEKVGYVDNPRN